ncbi:MAG TPA: hypothetical protein VNU64_09080 [Burkholderiales bacterium]|nr:hypothetical protein [Burkholderiales bacterium]
MTIAKKAAAAAFFIGAAAAHAQDAPRPDVKAGDTWVYQRTDFMDNHKSVLKLQVTFANEKVIHVVQVSQTGDKEMDSTSTAEWNTVVSARDGVFTPHSGLLHFPLHPGARWKSSYTVKFPRQDFDARHERWVTVVGWEDVQVPAGRFRALKVVSEGTVHRSDRPRPGDVSETVWYVPEVRRFVKWIFESRNRMGPVQSWEFDLSAYLLQP